MYLYPTGSGVAVLLIDLDSMKKIFNVLIYCSYNTVEDEIFYERELLMILYKHFIITICKLIYPFIYLFAPIIYFYLFIVFTAF